MHHQYHRHSYRLSMMQSDSVARYHNIFYSGKHSRFCGSVYRSTKWAFYGEKFRRTIGGCGHTQISWRKHSQVALKP